MYLCVYICILPILHSFVPPQNMVSECGFFKTWTLRRFLVNMSPNVGAGTHWGAEMISEYHLLLIGEWGCISALDFSWYWQPSWKRASKSVNLAAETFCSTLEHSTHAHILSLLACGLIKHFCSIFQHYLLFISGSLYSPVKYHQSWGSPNYKTWLVFPTSPGESPAYTWPLWLPGSPVLASSLVPSVHAAAVVKILRSPSIHVCLKSLAPLQSPSLRDSLFSKKSSPDFSRSNVFFWVRL